jgi:hypothetical protein
MLANLPKHFNLPITDEPNAGEGWRAHLTGGNVNLILDVKAYCFDNSP